MMKNFSIIATLLLMLTIFLFGCSSNSSGKFQTLSEVAHLKSRVITKIIFYDGRGRKPITVNNKQKIDEFMSYLDQSTVKKLDKDELKVGWIHNAVFYSKEKKLGEITFGNPIIIDKTKYYTVVKNNVSTEKIDHYLKAVN